MMNQGLTKGFLRRAALLGLAVLSAGGCAARQATDGGSPPAGYGDTQPSAPLVLRSASALAPVGRGAAEQRRLPRRAREFMGGVEAVPGALPVRESVWWGDAVPVSTDRDSVVFATAWVPLTRLTESIRCQRISGAAGPGARLAAVLRDRDGDLEVEAWIETSGVTGCEGDAGARERVRAFADDVEMFARSVARMGVPTPAR